MPNGVRGVTLLWTCVGTFHVSMKPVLIVLNVAGLIPIVEVLLNDKKMRKFLGDMMGGSD